MNESLSDVFNMIMSGKKPAVVVTEVVGDKKEYQAFLDKKMKKFGIKSLGDLEGQKEKDFYNEVDAEWKGDNEED